MTQALFLEMLTFARPAWTKTEEAFIERFIKPLNPHVDTFGNQIVDVGPSPSILWSSHTDTVHYLDGMQQLQVLGDRVFRKPLRSLSKAPQRPTVFGGKSTKPSKWDRKNKKDKKSNSKLSKLGGGNDEIDWTGDCLGADCTTGVYIMIEMIKAGVEGRYVFHRAEEIGCLGSSFILRETPEMLKGIQAAIAFDRKGNTEVITHQGHRTASDKFATSMAAILGGKYVGSPLGSITDTKIYAGTVPECSNIGVGYYNAHTGGEYQDLKHLEWLVERMRNFDPTQLVIDRTPAPAPAFNYGRSSSGFTRYNVDTTVEDLVRSYPMTIGQLLERAGYDFETLSEGIRIIQQERRSGFSQVAS